MHRSVRGTLALLVAAVCACSGEPVAEGPDDATPVQDPTKPEVVAPAIDVLWVVDVSKSMCREQVLLGAAFRQATQRFATAGLDYRMAVVDTDVLSESSMGSFKDKTASEPCFACAHSVSRYCLAERDDMCTDGVDVDGQPAAEPLGPGWVCSAPDKSAQIHNCNGSVNSKCRPLCTDDAECDTRIVGAQQGAACAQDPQACLHKCIVPSPDPKSSGCIPRWPTEQCPAQPELRAQLLAASQGTQTPYVTPASADLLSCVGVVGAESNSNANLPQAFNAAIAALNSEGPNATQAAEFLRADAPLLIVFISDGDDCSPGEGHTLKKEQYGTCECLNDTSEGGPLRPVDDVVAALRALKGDPEQVWVAALIADSLHAGTDEQAAAQDRADYRASKCSMCADPADQHPLLFNTQICDTEFGRGDYGRRFAEVVAAFGAQGAVDNLCTDAPLQRVLDTLLPSFQ